MDRKLWGLVLVLGGGALFAWACGVDTAGVFFDDAGIDGAIPPDGGGAEAGDSGGDSGDGGLPPECSGAPKDDPAVLTEDCGIFVSADGADVNPGSRALPKRTITAALQTIAGDGRRVYVCGGAYTETVTIMGDAERASIYGGMTCDSGEWRYGQSTTRVTGAATGALRVVGVTMPLTVADLRVDSLDASGAGSTSVGMWIEGSTVALDRVVITAGKGVDGMDGATSPGPVGAAASGNLPAGAMGAAMKSCVCPDGMSIGGAGGTGEMPPDAGFPGLPDLMGTPPAAGDGGIASASPGCADGGAGSMGAPGVTGVFGAGASGVGALVATGIATTMGADGGLGHRAQGGGGGGGQPDAGGSSGGCGGCGGFGGAGGKGGGSSVALVSLNATILLQDTTLVSGSAGDGGDGVAGQLGQPGGVGGATSCVGGQGGTGGRGGPGGGGAGGHSIGIATKGTPPVRVANVAFNLGAAGTGGLPGAGGSGMGVVGAQAEEIVFP